MSRGEGGISKWVAQIKRTTLHRATGDGVVRPGRAYLLILGPRLAEQRGS